MQFHRIVALCFFFAATALGCDSEPARDTEDGGTRLDGSVVDAASDPTVDATVGADAAGPDGSVPPSLGECDPLLADGRVRVVDPSAAGASDDNDGSPGAPWLSLSHAVTQVQPGDTVLVQAGRYVDAEATHYASFDPAVSGTADAPITFRSCPQLAAVLASASPIQAAFATSRDHIVVDGFRVEGTLKVQGGEYCVLENNEVVFGSLETSGPGVGDPSLNWGIALHSASSCVVRNNRVHSMRDSGNSGHNTSCVMVGFDSHHNLIEYNWADAGGGIVYSAFGTKGRGVEDNVWQFNVGVGATAAFFGIGSTDGMDPSYRSRYFHNLALDSDAAFELDHGCLDYTFEHNTSVGCPTFLYGGFGPDTWVNNRRARLWNNVAAGATAAFVRGEAPASWSVFLAESDHNFWDVSRIWDGNYGRELVVSADEWRSASGMGEGTVVGAAGVMADGRLPDGSPARGIGRDGVDPGAFGADVTRLGPTW